MGKLVFFALAGFGFAQASSDSTTPANPQSSDDKHILGVVPNYATVNDPSATFQAISMKEKFKLAAQDAFDPFSWVIAGIYAGVAQWGNSYPGYGQGAQGYAKRYGAAFADGTIGNYMTEAGNLTPRKLRVMLSRRELRIYIIRPAAGPPRIHSRSSS
jgi:hypothetical protein